ncbi:unnamed protein product [Phytophthora fragariaefolia]|uniref:Unnamed protein product n=1 Tax=Phytophthora fragariaefolia TaxID=1490495 RepID=A0A9W6Y8Q8_9STRA|nr:unnamed protein product [Phytophthora fragariaefolia]
MTHDHRSRIQNDGSNRSRSERSRYCIYAFVHKPAIDPGRNQWDLHGNTFDLCGKRTPVVSRVFQANGYSSSSDAGVIDLEPECRRDLSGQEAILAMDIMVPAVIRLDLADGPLCLHDEIRIRLSGSRQLYNDKTQLVRLDQHLQLGIGESAEVPMHLGRSRHDKLWVSSGDLWVPTVVNGPDNTTDLLNTNIGEKMLVLCRDERIGMWLTGDRIPHLQGFVSVGSRCYMERQNLALQATTDAGSTMAEPTETLPESLVERPKSVNPTAVGGKYTRDPAGLQGLVLDLHHEKGQIPDPTDSRDPGPDDAPADEQVCYHESRNLHAEDVAADMAVLPAVTSTTEEVAIEDIQVGVQILTPLKR